MEKPSYPNDIEELKHIEKLINRVDEFKNKLKELDEEIKKISKLSADESYLIKKQEIEGLIYKSFFQDIENKPFNNGESKDIARLKAEIVWDGVIFKRNLSCEICGENRSVDKCHIIPNRTGGLKEDKNLLYLCPTHHRLFDRFMLTKKEWAFYIKNF
jgi:predicted restriction endonuclease